jgi:hypothetical protein
MDVDTILNQIQNLIAKINVTKLTKIATSPIMADMKIPGLICSSRHETRGDM